MTQLRAAGAPLNPRCGNQHATPLRLLISAGAPLELVRSFLKDGADPDVGFYKDACDPMPAPSDDDDPPLPYVINKVWGERREALILILIQHGADPTLVMPSAGLSFRDTDLPGPGLRFHDTALTPLMIAIQRDDLRVVEMLLDHGASAGRHPHPEVLYSPLQLAAYLGQAGCVELLLNRGADTNDLRAEAFSRQKPIYYIQDYIGSSIQSAVVAGNLIIVDMLLRGNAHPDLTTPLTPQIGRAS